MSDKETVTVPVTDAWYSKINWTQIVTIAFAVLTYAGVTVPPELQPAVLTAVTAVSGVITIVFRTYFNASVPKQSLDKK